MLLVNGFKAIWYKHNRYSSNSLFDDVNSDTDKKIITTETIKVVPYNATQSVKFGIYTHPEARGYYMCKGVYSVKPGDQIKVMDGRTDVLDQELLTVIEVKNQWIFNKVEVNILVVR